MSSTRIEHPVAPALIGTLKPSFGSRYDLERHLSQLALGMVAALRVGEMTPEQACNELFNSRTFVEAKAARLSHAFIELLTWGMELEDVAALAPESLPESYAAISSIAARILRKDSKSASPSKRPHKR